MKHNKHTVKIYIYNPNNLKEIIGYKDFKVEYIPTKKWNVYLIVINDKYTGITIDISKVFIGGNSLSPRKLIGEAIKNYLDNNFINYQNRIKIYYPNNEIFMLVQKIFKKILTINQFKNREELTSLNLIIN